MVTAIPEVDSPVAMTRDIAESLDCTTEAARQKLSKLTEQGRVDRWKVGGRAVVWWLAEKEQVTTEINPDDLLFGGGAIFPSEDPIDETKIDDALYGDV